MSLGSTKSLSKLHGVPVLPPNLQTHLRVVVGFFLQYALASSKTARGLLPTAYTTPFLLVMLNIRLGDSIFLEVILYSFFSIRCEYAVKLKCCQQKILRLFLLSIRIDSG